MQLMVQSRVTVHRQVVSETIGQCHIEFFAEGIDEVDYDEV